MDRRSRPRTPGAPARLPVSARIRSALRVALWISLPWPCCIPAPASAAEPAAPPASAPSPTHLTLTAPPAEPSHLPVINEVLASHIGPDDAEFIELHGSPGAPLAGLSLIAIEGDAATRPGTIDLRIDLRPFHRLGPDGFFLIGVCTGLRRAYATAADRAAPEGFLENGSLTLALVETASLSGPSGSLVTGTERALDALALQDSDARTAGDAFFLDAPIVGPDGGPTPAGARRIEDGRDTDAREDFALASAALGPENTPRAAGLDGCSPFPLAIHEIQGGGMRSLFEGERVQTSAIVTQRAPSHPGFWIQDPLGDGRAETSDGIFVEAEGDTAAALLPGDRVRITGHVRERGRSEDLPLTLLELDPGPSSLQILERDLPLPAPTSLDALPASSLDAAIVFWEALEGMRVHVDDGVVVGPSDDDGELVAISAARAVAGSGFEPQTRHLRVRPLPGGRVDFNPERIPIGRREPRARMPARAGDRIAGLLGVVDYRSGSYRVEPSGLEIRPQSGPDALPVARRSGPLGDFAVTLWNVQNLFDTADDPATDDGPSTPTPAALERKLRKLALAFTHELALPAIAVLVEVENRAITQQLADRINAENGTDYLATSFPSSDARGIEVALLHDRRRARLVGAFPLQTPEARAAFGPESPAPGREPIVGRFRIGPLDRELVVIGNHFRSKLGDDPLLGRRRPPQRPSDALRMRQARAVRAFVESLLAQDPAARVLVAGDLNDPEFAEPGEGPAHPVAILEGSLGGPRLLDLVRGIRAASRFSFVFEGNAQSLDHLIASPALLRRLAGTDALHFCASFPAALAQDDRTPLRASDHDALEARFSWEMREAPQPPAPGTTEPVPARP